MAQGQRRVVGSNDSLLPWTGNTAPTPAQLAEVQRRTAATLRLIDQAFNQAIKEKQRAVVLLMQADMGQGALHDGSGCRSALTSRPISAPSGRSAPIGGTMRRTQ